MKKAKRQPRRADLSGAERALQQGEPAQALARLGSAGGGARAEHLRGLALARLGRSREAVTHLRRAAALDGRSAAVWADLGQACWESGRFADAAAALERAVTLAPDAAELRQALGASYQQAGDVARAIEVYLDALERHPDQASVHFNLGAAYKRQHRLEAAAAAYQRAHGLAPAAVEPAVALGTALVELGRFDAALAPLEAATRHGPARADLLGLLGYALTKVGRGGAAVQACRAAYEASGRNPATLVDLGSAQLAAGDAAGALASSETVLASAPGDRTALSNAAIALTELGRRDEALALVDPDRFIRPVRLSVPPGYADLAAFNQALVEHVFGHPDIELDRSSLSCHEGSTSGELMVEPLGPLREFAAALERAARDYVAELKETGASAHPFMRSQPAAWRLSAWATVLRDQGYQHGHIHALAWLSGVYYLALPSGVGDGRTSSAGCIEFGRPPHYFTTSAEHPTRTLRPEVGQLFLFPSFYYHRTLPFTDQQPRISIAFDFQAVDG